MISAGSGADIASGVLSAAGGIFGSLFGDDEQPVSGYTKEYGEEARKQRFGSLVGQRVAMGDPSAIAYFKSNPDKMKKFVDDFGSDFLTKSTPTTGSTYDSYNQSPTFNYVTQQQNPSFGLGNLPTGTFGLGINPITAANMHYNDPSDQDYSSAFDRTIARLSHPISGTSMGGYSSPMNQRTIINQSGGYSLPSIAPKLKTMSFDLNEGARKVGTGNKYAKAIMEAKTMGR